MERACAAKGGLQPRKARFVRIVVHASVVVMCAIDD
jgi:hypothetical protein